MSRVRIASSITPALNVAIRRVAVIENRTLSDLVEDALARYFDSAHRDAEHHAIIAKLQRLSQRLAALEKGLETLFELNCHATRFSMSVAPDIPERDRAALNARGSERFRNVIAAVVARLGSGRSALRDSFASAGQAPTPASDANGASQPKAPDNFEGEHSE